MATATPQATQPPTQSLLLNGISWKEYLRMGRLLADRPLRMTYDRGTLEIMTLSAEHERLKHLLRRLVDALSEEINRPIAGFGSMTCKRRAKRRGFEPDECYWVANEPAVRGKIHIDLRIDPPPDLGLEIDITSSSLNRMAIYSALQVPEVWRLNSQGLTFFGLQANGKYAPIPTSLAFPGLTPADLTAFLDLRGKQDENTIVKAFRAWVRQRFTPPAPTP